jgi:hypothetical protein
VNIKAVLKGTTEQLKVIYEVLDNPDMYILLAKDVSVSIDSSNKTNCLLSPCKLDLISALFIFLLLFYFNLFICFF